MGRLSALLLAFAAAVVAATALSACGGSDAELLPGKTASEIESNLDRVAQLAGEGECVGAEDAAQEVSAEVEALGGVDEKLKRALGEGADRLNEVVAGCEEEEPVEEEVEPVEEEELEPTEKPEKHQKGEKPEKAEKEEAEVKPEEDEETTPPPSTGKGKGAENGQGPEGNGPPGLSEPPSGGVGPSTEVEGSGD